MKERTLVECPVCGGNVDATKRTEKQEDGYAVSYSISKHPSGNVPALSSMLGGSRKCRAGGKIYDSVVEVVQ